ncbi:unnamed protein product [Cuscuta epithymum]|uniref:Uncharacterized protein n=1 Tax=Cuscuta epithymum TaxID=186058 RepID=A0AAV0GCE8_9ASTE|nr:unnamed protein product [Cuscuta epithymum]
MANSGGAGTKFVSVNLNKSYGQPYQRANQSYSGSYGQAASSRGGRPGSGGGGGGGMVVLSRPKSSQKVGPKLSVPPPLNLPSLRKEHQKFDVSGPGSGATSVGGSGGGTKTSSGVGWTKPAPAIGLQGKDGDTQVVEGTNYHESGAYMPPSARSGGIGSSLAVSTKHLPLAAEKASVLWGEDFPSLKAALPVPSVPSHKQKDSSNQKQKVDEEYSNQANHSSGSLDMRPHGLAARQSIENRPVENGVGGHDLDCPSRSDHSWKQEEYFTGPLPLVRLNPRSDWADDERDTGHGFVDRSSRESRMVKSENYWSSDFDMPRTSVLPHKLPNVNQYERWGGQRDNETGIVVSSEVIRGGDTYHRDSRTESRDGNMWKSSPLPRVGNVSEAVNIRNAVSSRVFALNKDTGKEGKYFPPQLGETANRDSTFGTKEAIHSSDVHKHWSNDRVSYNSRGIDRSNRFGYQNSNGHTPSFTSPGKSVAVSVPVPNHGRDKSAFSRHEKPYIEDFGSAGFDERDILSGGLVGVIKRKKDVVKQTDFHDPVRESFEAELERVQKMQELERQRIIEEQERALEQAQKEEEERQRLVREEEERHRRLEEEAREAAWRAEQEQLEAIRRADEQKAAREEERRRLFLEEERRKQAAKQKLLELEARIAKREADRGKCDPSIPTTIPDEKPSVAVKENEASDPDNWDESERMVERLTTSIYPEAPVLSGSAEMGLRPYNSRDSFSDFADAGKPINSWRRDVFGTGSGSRFEHDSGHLSPRRDASGRGVRLAPQKEFYGGSSYMSSRTLIMKDAMQEAFVDEFGEPKEEDRWNFSEFHDNLEEKYNDIGWRQGSSRGGNSRFPFPGQSSYHNSETDDHFSYGKSRYSMRQPRVLPPPTVSTFQRHSFRGENEIAVASEFAGSNKNVEPTESDGNHLERSGTSLAVDLQQNSSSREEKLVKDMGSRCDSQSSLSVTSPPNSPPHLSNDELDESGDSPVVSAAAGGQNVTFSGTKPFMKDVSRKDVMRTASSSISIAEDEEWTVENNDDLPRQEEYDDEEDGYREGDDELLNEDDYNVDLNQDLEGMHLGDRVSSPNSHNLVLGFNEGVEVAIPSDDFERNLRNDESIFDRDDTYVHNSIPEEQGAINCVQVDDKCYQPAAEGSSQSSSGCENERAVQEAVKGPAIVPHTSNTSNILDGVDAPSGALSSAASQADLSTKLQFGLFSGPTLIPSPVPAIQIGSIQMPLHLHPPVGTSLAHMHPSQPSFFQFGQFRYSPPISQGMLPGTALPVSFIQPKLQSNKYNVNQCNGGYRGQSHRDDSELDSSSVRAAGNNAQTLVINSEVSGHTETKEQDSVDIQSNLESSKRQNVSTVSRVISGGFKSQGSFSGTKGKRFTYAVKNNSARSTSNAFETFFSDFNGFQRRPRRTVQRTEFRVRENADKRQFSGALPVNDTSFDDKAAYGGKYGGFFTRSGSKRGSMPNKSMKHTVEAEKSSQGSNGSQNIATMKDHVIKRQSGLSNIREGNLKRNNIYEEDVDAPLQSGVVRVFKQPGIEAPSDEDDFIQVRSKRQMLNDRREQREREIKAKSRALKQPRKPHIARQNNAASTSLNKSSVHISLKTHSAFATTEGQGSTNKPEAISCSANLVPPIAQICTPAIDAGTESDIRSNKSLKAPPATVVSGSGSDGMSLMFEGNKCEGAVMSMSSKSWCTPCVNQQSQLEEAMKPVKFETQDSCSTSGSHISSSVSEPALPSSSSIMMANDKSSFLLTTSPINSLLAGEKIQFGAVTSPTILPVSTRVVSHGIGAPGSKRPSDVQISHNLSATKNDCSLFDKLPNDCSVSLQDSEAEAEAAASAVAVAAITNDEGGENGLGSVTASEAKKIFEGGRQLGSQSRVEEPLSVSLPADLSVENHPISLWPRVSDPQNPSGQMLSHFPGGPPPSHIPIYEMNPVLGGPIFSFGPHEESTVSQTQPQKSTGTGSGPLSAWQQCHSSMDSFYAPPSGFTGPLYSPTGRIPGVQGPPPHMVVYNHFAPFGQFGQVGLSFMGTTYIASSGKQHNPNSTMVGGMNEGDMNIISSTQRNASSAPVQQHLAPGSPLIPMASPLAMFDVSPFQPPPPDMQHWSSMHTAALHSAAISLPPLQHQQQQPEAAPFDQGRHSADQSLNVVSSRFPPDSLASTTAPENCPKKFPAPSSVNNNCNNSNKNNNSPTAQFMDRLGGQSSENAGASTTRDIVGKSDNNNNNRVEQTTATTTNAGFSSHQMPRQHRNPSLHHHQSHSSGGYNGYYHGRGNGIPQRNNEWSYRRTGFHGGRNQTFNGGDRGFSSTTRVKQIYVAKQSNSGSGGVTKTEG